MRGNCFFPEMYGSVPPFFFSPVEEVFAPARGGGGGAFPHYGSLIYDGGTKTTSTLEMLDDDLLGRGVCVCVFGLRRLGRTEGGS